jgi:hypothetical protein
MTEKKAKVDKLIIFMAANVKKYYLLVKDKSILGINMIFMQTSILIENQKLSQELKTFANQGSAELNTIRAQTAVKIHTKQLATLALSSSQQISYAM